jgi:23S rRNA-/tRNA-specific pseudouridylate synthase
VSNLPRLLFQSDDFLAVEKPAGWLSIPAREPGPADAVLSRWLGEATGLPVFVIHRLDRFTSGIMLFARNEKAHRLGSVWFQNRQVKKTYHFLASPPPGRPAVQIKTPVAGKPAQTLFEVIEKTPTHFYGRATPLTGRFHQIREHAAEAGFPLLGDPAYSGAPSARVCLHAYELETPIGTFTSPLASDLSELWSTLKCQEPK